MPSGAKKRKAAKKRKEQQAVSNINSSTDNNPHGNDDMKSLDERDSDGGDVGSPASQVNHNHREEERKTAPSPVESHVTEEKSLEEATRDAESMEKSGLDDVETERARIWHVEHDKRSSCSSSSDYESQASEKMPKAEETWQCNGDKSATVVSMKVAENGTHGDVNGYSAVEAAAVENSVKTVTEEVGNGTEISANESVESRSNESETESLLLSNGISGVELEGKVSSSSSTPPAETSHVEENTRDSEPHDSTKKQPLVATTPPTVKRTTLLSCCGLFDVLTGSNR
ncbi:hypothetical protein V6N11_029074 [Hibiscus sabdariffa]|uniref:Uncharacterized protein n=2 Tax=Hibiscus sabdariffa TaxID=183260 RepID=A0ABR2CWK8_9ROSI